MNNILLDNNIYRLALIKSLLIDGRSINSLAECLKIEKKIIYDDIITLNNYPDSRLTMKIKQNTDTYSEDDDELDRMDRLLHGKEFEENLRNGIYDGKDDKNNKDDNEYIFLIAGNTVEVVLTSDELDVLNSFINDESVISSFYVKNNNILRSEEKVDMVNYILATIKDGKSIEFSYKAKSGIQQKVILPIKIIHNTTEDTFYVFDHKGISYNLDNVLPDSIRESNYVQKKSKKIDDKRFEKMWGVNYSEKGTVVKLKIYNEGNVIERVRNDLGRKLTEDTFHYNEDDPYAIYEDEVIGTEVFLSWVYSYGSSMVILEPRELVDKVIDSIEKRKEMYDL